MTQEALSEAVGVSARYVQSLEAGEYFPTLPTLVKIKQALACSWDVLLADCEAETHAKTQRE